MPLEPLRSRIRRALLDELSTIQAGTEYWLTPSLVTLDPLGIEHYADDQHGGQDDLATGPVYGIARTPGSQIEPSTHDGEDDGDLPSGFQGEFRFAIVVYVRGDATYPASGYSASERLDQAQQDIERCLRAKHTLDGLVTDLKPDGADMNDGGVYAAENEAECAQVWVARLWP